LIYQHVYTFWLVIIVVDGIGDISQDGRLSGFRLSHKQSALAFANGGKEINHSRGIFAGFMLKLQPIFRVDGQQVLKILPVVHICRDLPIYSIYTEQCKITLSHFEIGRASCRKEMIHLACTWSAR